MSEIIYSRQLLVDFNKLLSDFNFFMTMNLVHAGTGLEVSCQAKVSQLIRYSLDNSKITIDFFKPPLLNNEQQNKEKLMKNIQTLTKFFYDYLSYAEPILKECLSNSDLYKKRFLQLKTHYVEFHAKYLQ